MPKLQKTFPMLALAALIIVVGQTSASAGLEDSCKIKCDKAFPNLGYTKCETSCPLEDNNCKKRCSKENPSPKYDNCKKKCLEETNSSKKGKRLKK